MGKICKAQPDELTRKGRIPMLNICSEAARCLLCDRAGCTAACPKSFDPAGMLRSVRFENAAGAAWKVDAAGCAACEGPCEKACLHDDFPLRIRQVAAALPGRHAGPEYSNLAIDFLGVHCENPFFLSSSVVASSYEMCARALSMGWAGVVYKTIGLFIPQEVSPRFDAIGKEGTPFVGFRNLEQISDHDPDENFEILRRLKAAFPEKVIVSSIMGRSEAEWTELARRSEQAGADIIECNFSCPQMCGNGLGSDVGQDPELVRAYTAAVKKGTGLPVLAKMTPNLANMEPPAIAACAAGADGLAAINTVKSITGVDLEDLVPLPRVDGRSAVSGYSGKAVKPIALRFIHDMAVCSQLQGVPISGMGGMETWRDAAEFLALGCSNLQITTAVMQYGYRIIDDLLFGLSDYLKTHGFSTVGQLVGRALDQVVPAEKLNRSTLVYPKFDHSRCLGCGRCCISCRDGEHQAITMQKGKPALDAASCVGCHLCRLVCPAGAIGVSRRMPKP